MWLNWRGHIKPLVRLIYLSKQRIKKDQKIWFDLTNGYEKTKNLSFIQQRHQFHDLLPMRNVMVWYDIIEASVIIMTSIIGINGIFIRVSRIKRIVSLTRNTWLDDSNCAKNINTDRNIVASILEENK